MNINIQPKLNNCLDHQFALIESVKEHNGKNIATWKHLEIRTTIGKGNGVFPKPGCSKYLKAGYMIPMNLKELSNKNYNYWKKKGTFKDNNKYLLEINDEKNISHLFDGDPNHLKVDPSLVIGSIVNEITKESAENYNSRIYILNENELKKLEDSANSTYQGPAEGHGKRAFVQIMTAITNDDEEITCWYGKDYPRKKYVAKECSYPFQTIKNWGGTLKDDKLKNYKLDEQAIEEQHMIQENKQKRVPLQLEKNEINQKGLDKMKQKRKIDSLIKKQRQIQLAKNKLQKT